MIDMEKFKVRRQRYNAQRRADRRSGGRVVRAQVQPQSWTLERIELLYRTYSEEGHTAEETAVVLGTTKRAVQAKIYDLKIDRTNVICIICGSAYPCKVKRSKGGICSSAECQRNAALLLSKKRNERRAAARQAAAAAARQAAKPPEPQPSQPHQGATISVQEAIAIYLRDRGATHCPTAAVAATTARPTPADVAALAAYRQAQDAKLEAKHSSWAWRRV